MSDERLDEEKVVQGLRDALTLQYTSAISFAVGAGAVAPLEYRGIAQDLWSFAEEEFRDIQVLVEKLTALGGQPPLQPPTVIWNEDIEVYLRELVEHENKTTEALHAIIPATGQEARSEALEHLMEHSIMRKQRQIDLLSRSLRNSGR